MKDISVTIKRYIHRAAARLVTVILRPGAVYDGINFRLWENHGYHITPIHFYSPIPDTRELEMKDFKLSDCHGIALRPEYQLKLLKESFSKFQQDYNTIPIEKKEPKDFCLDNDSFSGIDPHIYYCMIRHFKPRMIIEVGSGNSTLLGAKVCQQYSIRYVCIDPWPRDFIAEGVPGVELICQKVEDIDIDFFMQFKSNDILFVDGSHVVRTAGDVNYIILEILPKLAPGVIIHFHDIFLPCDYPKDWVVVQQRFWTEQYLLQAYLVDNSCIEVLFGSHFMSKTYSEDVKSIFPTALWIDGVSFWIRKCRI